MDAWQLVRRGGCGKLWRHAGCGKLWRHARAGCQTVGAVGSCPATQRRDLRLEAVPSFLGATCSSHATRGSLEVTMLGGMGGQTLG